MNSIDKITRDTKILLDSAKDTVTSNLMNAIRTKEVEIPEAQLSRILMLVNSSIDQGYQKALTSYQNSIKKHM